jgi:hypothetical protein
LENRVAIMKSCMANGTLLQPGRALTAIDAVFLGMAFTDDAARPNGVVMTTDSEIGGHRWGLVLAAELKVAYELPVSTIFSADSSMPAPAEHVVVESNFTMNSTAKVHIVPRGGTFLLPVSDKVNFTLHSLAPVSVSGWALLGELSKWVPVSAARFKAVATSGGVPTAKIAGMEGEVVAVSFYRKASSTGAASVVTCSCVLPASGTMTVSGADPKCHSAA